MGLFQLRGKHMAFDEGHFASVRKEVERHLEDTDISKVSHWEAAKVYDRRHRFYLGVPATLLSIVVSWLISGQTQRTADDFGIGGALAQHLSVSLSLAVSLLSGMMAFLNLNDLATRHRSTAEDLYQATFVPTHILS